MNLRLQNKKTGLCVLFIMAMVSLILILPFCFLPDQIFTQQVETAVQKSLSKDGLQIKIANLRWIRWDQMTSDNLVLTDIKDGTVPIRVKQINLHFDLFGLIKNLGHPEACLREVDLFQPQLKLFRHKDGTWNLQQYFKSTQRKLVFNTNCRIKDGIVDLNDPRYGEHRLFNIKGQVNLTNYPLASWQLDGKTNIKDEIRWSSKGQTRVDQRAGIAEFAVQQAPIVQILKYIPSKYLSSSVHASSGQADCRVNFTWNQGVFCLEKAQTQITDASITIPNLARPFNLKLLRAEFTPTDIKIITARFAYNQADIKMNGALNLKSKNLTIQASADQIQLADLAHVSPKVSEYGIEGVANVRISASGTFTSPNLNGEIFLNGGRVRHIAHEEIRHISGRIVIHQNDLKIEHLEGLWQGSLIGVSGEIENVFHPNLKMKMYGEGLDLSQIQYVKVNRIGLQVLGKTNLDGKISGTFQEPIVSGELYIPSMSYKKITLNQVRAQFDWDFAARKVLIRQFGGSLWEGCFLTHGQIYFGEKEVNWRLASNIDDLNLEKVELNQKMALKGRISCEGVLTGHWSQGEPFRPGSIIGLFKGNNLIFDEAYIDYAHGTFNLENDSLTVESLQANIGSGRVFGQANYEKDKLNVKLTADGIELRHFLPNAKKFPLDGLFKGNMSLEGTLDHPNGEIEGTFENTTWTNKTVGTINGSLSFTNQSLTVNSVIVNTESGDLIALGQIHWGIEPELNLQIKSNNIRLSGLAKWLPIDQSLKMDGSGLINVEVWGTASDPKIHGTVILENPSLGSLKMTHGQAEIIGDLNEITITKMQLSSAVTAFEASGKMSRDTLDLDITGRSFALESLNINFDNKVLKGRVDLQGKLAGKPSSPILAANITGQDFSFGVSQYRNFTAQVNWDGKTVEINNALLSKEDGSSLRCRGSVLISKPLQVDMEFDLISGDIKEIMQLVKYNKFNVDGKISGVAHVAGYLNNPNVQINASLDNGIINSVPVNGNINLSYSQNKIDIQQINLQHRGGMGSLQITGAWEYGRLLKLNMQIKDFPIQTIAPFVKLPWRVEGLANANVSLGWSNTEISGDCQIHIANFYLKECIIGDLNLTGHFSERGLTVTTGSLSYKKGITTFAGYVPWPDETVHTLSLPVKSNEMSQSVDVKLILNNTCAEIANVFAPNYRVQGGFINGQLQLVGQVKNPDIFGKVDCTNAGVLVDALPLPIQNVQATIVVSKDQWMLRRARGIYGKGKFVVTGGAVISGYKLRGFDLSLVGTKAYYSNVYFDGYADLNVRLTGSLTDSTISGDIVAYDSKVGILGVPSSAKEAIWKPRMDLNIRSGNNVRYRQLGLADVTIKGQLSVKGIWGNPVLNGSAQAVHGVLMLYGQTFKVDFAKATFNNSEGFQPFIEVDSEITVPKAEIFLTMKGQLGTTLALNVTSQPYMSQTDIYSLLNWSDLRGDKPMTVDSMSVGNISFLTDSLFGDAFFEVRRAFRLDYLYLEHDYKLNDFRINVGDYLTDQLFVSYSRSVSNDPNMKWSFDYNLTPKLVAGESYSIDQGRTWHLTYRIHF